jgi:hypothetical protein
VAKFKDNQGRTWNVAIDGGKLKTVRDVLGVHLAAGGEAGAEALAALARDPARLVDTLYLLCRDQAERAGVSDEQFGRSLLGDAIDRAVEALLAALREFFPREKAETVGRFAEREAELRTEAERRALAKIEDPRLRERAVGQLNARREAELRALLKASAGR